MRIFAVRDRLIDYYMQPFAAPGVKDVLAALANQVNTENQGNAIYQAPHHFEIWQLGIVTEDGHITPEREFIADCSSLVRASVRRDGKPGGHPAEGPPGPGQGPPDDRAGGAGTYPGPLPNAPHAAPSAPPGPRQEPRGGHSNHYRQHSPDIGNN